LDVEPISYGGSSQSIRRCWFSNMPRTQILDAQTHHKDKDKGLRGKLPKSPRQKREIYWSTQDYKRITISSLKNSLRKILNPELHPLFIGRRRNSQTAPGQIQNQFWPDCWSRSTDPSVRSTARSIAKNPLSLQDLLEMSLDRAVEPTDPTGFLFLVQHRSTARSTKVCRLPGRSKSVIELENSISCFCPLSLQALLCYPLFIVLP